MEFTEKEKELINIQSEWERNMFFKQTEEEQKRLLASYAYNREVLRAETFANWNTCGAVQSVRNKTGFEHFISKAQKQNNLKAICEETATTIINGGSKNMILIGKAGVGKTFFSLSTLKKVVTTEKPRLYITKEIGVGKYGTPEYHTKTAKEWVGVKMFHTGLFVKATDMVDDLTSFGKVNKALMDRYAKPEILVIDEVGRNTMTQKAEQSILFRLIDARNDAHLSTIITSNLTSEDLEAFLGEATFSRLSSNCVICDLNDLPDMRANYNN